MVLLDALRACAITQEHRAPLQRWRTHGEGLVVVGGGLVVVVGGGGRGLVAFLVLPPPMEVLNARP